MLVMWIVVNVMVGGGGEWMDKHKINGWDRWW